MDEDKWFDKANGYWMVNITDHPLFPGKTCVALHRKMMAEHLGRRLLPTEIVHHKNEVKTDNWIENFEIVTRAEHLLLHVRNLQTPDKGFKISEAAARIGADPEERKRRSERAKAQHEAKNFGHHTHIDPKGAAENRSKGLKTFYSNEEASKAVREKSSSRMQETQKRLWADPEYKERMRKVLSENARKRWAKKQGKE